jgi:hypothetical protein
MIEQLPFHPQTPGIGVIRCRRGPKQIASTGCSTITRQLGLELDQLRSSHLLMASLDKCICHSIDERLRNTLALEEATCHVVQQLSSR